MLGLHKSNSKFLSIALAIPLFFALTGESKNQHSHFLSFHSTLQDTVKPIIKNNVRSAENKIKTSGVNTDTIPVNNRVVNDTNTKNSIDTIPNSGITDSFSLRLSKDTLDAPVTYKARDSAVLLVEDEKFLLYGKTRTTHKDVVLTAPNVVLDQKTNILTAVNEKDSLGDVVERARFEQGENKFETDTITYNFKTQKGLTKNTFTQQSDIFIQGETIKKVDPNTVFIHNGKFTTCNYDEPHFHFGSKRIKVVNNNVAVTGYVQLAFEGVPIPKPVGLPFGMFPLSKGRHSGLLPPRFTVNEQMGLGLEGLGYHKVLNEYIDVTLRGNIYSYGGWSASITPTYRKRYRYNGTFNLNIQSTKYNFKGDPDFSKSNTFNINWNHTVDQKARPGTNFSASVNAGSTRHNENVPNDPNRYFQNRLNSSISYSKTWAGKPYNLTLSANHSQENSSRLVQLRLPDAGFTVNTIFPFQRKEAVGEQRWYEKIGLGYNGSLSNMVSFYDTGKVSFSKIIDTIQWGVRHNVPLSISLPPLGNFIVSPGISYQENWLGQKFRRTWNQNAKKLDTSITKGLYTDRNITFSLGVNTTLYGTATFKSSRLVALRHVVRPNISFNYKPDLSKRHFYNTQVNEAGSVYRFSEFEGSLFGGFAEGRFGGISFGVDNNVEMKVRTKDSANTEKKVRLIDGFGFTSSYNFLADSLRIQPFQFYLRSTLFEKVNLTAQALLDPYQKNNIGQPIDRFVWQGNRFSPGRVTSGSLTLTTDFRSKPRNGEVSERANQNPSGFTDPSVIGDQQRLVDYMNRNPAEFVDFNIPWSISLSLSVFFTQQLKSDYSGYTTEFNSSVNFNNSFSLTPKWNFSTNGFFNLKDTRLESFQMSISREMHCWQMSIGVTPIGPVRFFNITISPKSSLLQDLRVNRTRVFYDY